MPSVPAHASAVLTPSSMRLQAALAFQNASDARQARRPGEHGVIRRDRDIFIHEGIKDIRELRIVLVGQNTEQEDAPHGGKVAF